MFGCMRLASKIAVNTTLAAAAGGLTALLSETLLGAPGDIAPVLNGILAGESSVGIQCFLSLFTLWRA